MNALDKRADRLRLEYCASLGVTYFPKWQDIKNEKTREHWRAKARVKPRCSFQNPDVVARAVKTRVANQRTAARKKKVSRLSKRFPWSFTG
jgi:hypothetical protein